MSHVPNILDEGRVRGVALVATTAVGQAIAAGFAAFATRDIFLALHSGDSNGPVLSFILLLMAGAAIAGLRIVGRSSAEKVGQDFAISLRHALFSHLTHMPSGAVLNRRTGALAIRFVGDLAAARNWAGLGVARIVAAGIVIPGTTIALVALNPALAAAAAVPLLASIAIMLAIALRIAPLHRRLRRKRANLAIDMMERVSAAPELLLMGRAKVEFRNLKRRGRELRDTAVGRAVWIASMRHLPDFGIAAAAVALLWVALGIGAAPAEAAGALAILGILAQPIRNLAGVWDSRCAWRIARAKCEALLSSPTMEPGKVERGPRNQGPVRVEFQHLKRGVLDGLNVDAMPGTKIAVIGPNGAGKSTCLALAAGLEQADDGCVRIDGVDIRGLPFADRQRSIVYVGPRSPILQGSIRRALTLGIKPRPDDDTIEVSARAYGLGDVIDRLGGLDGKVAEGGRNLSSGEARRVHLVRAALAKPSLILLDEPDEALDVQGRDCVARLVQETVATTLIVTRDPFIARRADVLWYLEAGALRAKGKPEDLIGHDYGVRRFFHSGIAA